MQFVPFIILSLRTNLALQMHLVPSIERRASFYVIQNYRFFHLLMLNLKLSFFSDHGKMTERRKTWINSRVH